MIIQPFPAVQGSQRTSVISQCYCGLRCVYTRVWCHMNDYISSFCSVKWLRQGESGSTHGETTDLAVSQQHTWPRVVPRDHSGFYKCVCVSCVQSSYIVTAVTRACIFLWPWISADSSHGLYTVCTHHTCNNSFSACMLTLSQLSLKITAEGDLCGCQFGHARD